MYDENHVSPHVKTTVGRKQATLPFPHFKIFAANTTPTTFNYCSTAQYTMKYTRAISLTNFLVASSALGFQVFVLYPWHKELDAGFEALKKEHLKVLDAAGDSLSERQRKKFSEELDDLKHRSSRRWWQF
jgi:hypothetical protein